MKKIIPALIFTAAAAGATAIYIKKKLFDNNKVKLIELEFQQDEDIPDSTEVHQQDEVLVEVNVLPQHETKVEETVEQNENVELASDNEEVNSIQDEETVEQSENVEFVSDNEEVDSVQDEETVDDVQNEEIEVEEVQDGLLTEEEIVEEIEPVISDEELSEIEQIVDQFVTQQQSEKTESIADDHLSFQEDQVDTVAQIDDITTEIDQIIGDIINQDETSNETLGQDEIETVVDENTIDDLISNLE